MGLETGNYISDLVNTNPAGGDERSTADDHFRLIKAVLLLQFPNFTAAAMTATVAELNKLTGHVGAVPQLGAVQAWTKQQYFSIATLTDAGNIAWNLDDGQVATVTLGGNRTLDNPTNLKAGAVYTLIAKQDVVGSRTLAYGTKYKWAGGVAPVLSAGPYAVDILCFVCDGTNLFGAINLDLK